jgi:hypothetical protein
MGTYFQYTGVGGSVNGTGLPTSYYINNSEKVIAMTPVPDNRQPIQGGVLITANVAFGIATAAYGTFLCRQSTLGTSTGVTGTLVTGGGNSAAGTYVASIGTSAGIGLNATIGGESLVFQWVDYLGTGPLPVYQITGSTSAGTATVTAAYITVTPLAT